MRPLYLLNLLLAGALLAGVLVAGIAVFLVAGIVSPGSLAPEGWFRNQLNEIDGLGSGDKDIAAMAGAAFGAAAALLLLLQAIPLWSPARYLHLADSRGDRITVTRESLERMVQQACAQFSSVRRVSASFRKSDDGLVVVCDAWLEPRASLADAAAELESLIRSEIQTRTGVRVSAVHINLELLPPGKEAPGEVERKREPAAH